MSSEIWRFLAEGLGALGAVLIIWKYHEWILGILPSGSNLYFRRKSDGRAVTGAPVGNGRGRRRITDDIGCIPNAPRAWTHNGAILLVSVDGVILEVHVSRTGDGDPAPIIVDC